MQTIRHVSIVIGVSNATAVTGSAITLLQSKDVSGTGEKAISFSKAYRNVDQGAGSAFSEFAVGARHLHDRRN